MSFLQRRAISWARTVALQRNRYALAGERAPIDLEAKFDVALRMTLAPVKKAVGLDRASFLVAGAASIERSLLEFFASFDLLIREEYGQSECTGPIAVNTPVDTRWGTVGFALPGIELRIDASGEIAVRGPNVFQEYFKDVRATAEVFRDGWLFTGDFGEFDDAGHLRLFGRRRDFLVTSLGKKVPRKPIEAALAAIEPIHQALVIGEGRDFLVALLTLNESNWEAFARSREWPLTLHALVRDIRFLDYLNEQIARRVNADREMDEHVTRFHVVPRSLSRMTGELDREGNVERTVCEQVFLREIEALYREPRPPGMAEGRERTG
jgi:long-chain acyl-CoA synthetase